MHAALILWSGPGPRGSRKPLFAPVGMGSYRMLQAKFAEFTFHALR